MKCEVAEHVPTPSSDSSIPGIQNHQPSPPPLFRKYGRLSWSLNRQVEETLPACSLVDKLPCSTSGGAGAV